MTQFEIECIQNSVLSFTGQYDMTYSEVPSWCPLELSEGDKVIFTVCGGSKIYDKNNLGLLGWAIHLKPQNLSYLNSQLVEVVVFVFVSLFIVYMWVGCVCLLVCLSVYVLCDCVLVCLCLCEMTDASKNMTKSTQPFISAPSTWSLKISHITTAGSANNSRHYRVVWLNADVVNTASQKSSRQFRKYCWPNLNYGKINIFISNTFSMLKFPFFC